MIFTSCTNDQAKTRKTDNGYNEDTSTYTTLTPDTGSNSTNRDTISIADRKEDSTFLVQTLSGGVMEVRLGELAMKRARQKSTQKLGISLIQDHSKVNEEIIQLLQQQKILVNDTLIKQHALKIKEFEKVKDPEFDAKYIREMQKNHRENISRFESQLNKTNNTTVRAFVNRILPVLRNHQNHIETIVKEEQ